MFEILKDVKNGERNASDISGYAVWWIGRTFWFWFIVVIVIAAIVVFNSL